MGMKTSTGLSAALQSNNGSAVKLPAGSVIENNIFYMKPQSFYGQTYNQYMYFPYGLSGGTIDHNVFYGGATNQNWRIGGTAYPSISAYRAATGYDTQSLTSDPSLVNGGGRRTLSWTPALHNGPQPGPAAYALAAGAPAIGAGATVSAATRDYYGSALPTGGSVNIGAYDGTSGGKLAFGTSELQRR